MSDISVKDELFFDEKKYLSSKYAGKITGYTNDYIARLCRQGKIKGQIVGKTWYVEKDSLADFSIENNKKKTKNREQLSQKRKKELNGPFVHPTEQKIKTFPALVQNTLFKKSVALAAAVFLVSGAYFLQAIQPSIYGHRIVNTTENTLNINNKNAVSVYDSYSSRTLVAAFFANVAESTDMIFEKTWRSMVSTFRSFVIGAYKTLTQRFTNESNNFVVDIDKNAAQFNEEREVIAIVVVPSTGSYVEDNKIKQKIKNSFSDEVKVFPDESGRSGIVRPVFKGREGQNYLYMLVPFGE